MVEESEQSAERLSNKISQLETRIKGQDHVISGLEAERRDLGRARDENIAKNNNMQTMRRNLRAFQVFKYVI